MKKRWLKAVVAAAALIVILIAMIPFFVNADTFRPKIQDELSSALGRKVTLGHISLSLLSGSLVAENISIADDPNFSSAPFLEARELHIGVELGALIFQRSLHITTFTVDSPSIQLIHSANGTWNFSSLGGNGTQPASQQAGAPPSLAVNELKIENGSATLSSVPAAGNPFKCTDLNLTVENLSFTQSFPFELALKVAGDGSLSQRARRDRSRKTIRRSRPSRRRSTSSTSIPWQQVRSAQRRHFHGRRLQCAVASKDGNLTTTGTAAASQLKLARNETPAPRPVNINFNLSDNLRRAWARQRPRHSNRLGCGPYHGQFSA